MNRRRIAIILLALIALAGCGSTKADTVGLKYNEGPIEGESFDKLVEPGSGQQFVWNDKIVELPINQRDYTACAQPRDHDRGCDGTPIRVAAKGGAELDISLGVTFKLNTGDAKLLRRFYEQICKKFGCNHTKGWDEMLRVNFRGPIEQAVQQQVRNFTVDELYAGVPAEGSGDKEDAVSTLDKVQTALAKDLKDNINRFVGGNYFCGPGYDRSKPKVCSDFVFQITDVSPVDPDVRKAFAENVSSRQDAVTAENRAKAKVAEAQGAKDVADKLASVAGIPGYIDYLNALANKACAERDGCTFVRVDPSANVVVNGG